jgi:hypothetical protein
MTSITIEGKDYPIKFGYGAFKRLGLLWEQEGTQGVVGVIKDSLGDMGTDPKFEALEKLADLVNAGIDNAGGGVIDKDDILNELVFKDIDKLHTVVNAFLESMPNQDKGKKKVSQKKASKPKAKK